MTAKEFQTGLLRLNSKLKVVYGGGRVDGLYIKLPRHPMANPENGLKHLGGIPSHSFFTKIPKFDFWDDACGGFNRGYHSILRYLTTVRPDGWNTVINRDEAIRVFGPFDKRAHPMPKPIKLEWWGKKRMKEKYQLNNLPSNTMGQAVVNV